MSQRSKLIIFIVFDITLIILLAGGVKMGWWNNFDLQTTRIVQSLHPQIWDMVMKAVSWPGYPPQTIWITPAILVVLSLILGIKKGIFITISQGGAYISGNLIKIFVDRSRPENFGITPWQQGLEGGRRSFPAGHVEIFVAIGLVTASFFHKKWLTIIIVILLILLGISRVYLGEHWTTDVIAGYLIGIMWAVMIVKLHESTSHLQSTRR